MTSRPLAEVAGLAESISCENLSEPWPGELSLGSTLWPMFSAGFLLDCDVCSKAAEGSYECTVSLYKSHRSFLPCASRHPATFCCKWASLFVLRPFPCFPSSSAALMEHWVCVSCGACPCHATAFSSGLIAFLLSDLCQQVGPLTATSGAIRVYPPQPGEVFPFRVRARNTCIGRSGARASPNHLQPSGVSLPGTPGNQCWILGGSFCDRNKAWARNTCIGRSGARAMPLGFRVDSSPHTTAMCWILRLAGFLVPLARSFLALCGLSVLALLGHSMAGRHSPLGSLVFAPSLGAPCAFALAIGRAGGPSPLLDWSVRPKQVPKHKRTNDRTTSLPTAADRLLGCTPRLIWAPPQGFPNLSFAGLFCSPGFIRLVIIGQSIYCVSAMTAPFGAFQRVTEEVELHPIPPQESATYHGSSWPPRPPLGPTHSPDVVPLGPARPTTMPPGSGPWLAVNVHAPHFRSVDVACRVPAGADLHHVAELVKAYSGGVPPGVFDVITPVRPLRFAEFAEFVRLPHVIRYQSGMNLATIILDLTRVGGNYFPYSLPRTMGHQAFLDFVQDHIRVEADEVYVFVGTRPEPWPRREPFEFRDGDAVILSIHRNAQVQTGNIEALFLPDAQWGDLNNLPKLHPASGVYILHGPDSYFIADYHHSGVGTAKAVSDRLRTNLQAITTCSFESHDFDFGGKNGHTIFCVADLPWPHADPLQSARRDVFILCDLRALGKPPEMVYTNHPVLHLPSVCARFVLRLPPSYKIHTIGGREVDEEVFVEEHSVLVFTAVPAAADATGSEGPADSNSEQERERELPPSPVPETTDAEGSSQPRLRSIRFSPHAAEFINDDFTLSTDSGTGGVLGITLHAPYYQEDYLAIFFDPAQPSSSIPDRIRASEPRIPLDALECIVPIDPLPDPGFGAYLAYPPSSIVMIWLLFLSTSGQPWAPSLRQSCQSIFLLRNGIDMSRCFCHQGIMPMMSSLALLHALCPQGPI